MNTLIRLFYDLSVYKEIIQTKLRSSLARFSVAYLIISIGLGSWLSVQYLPKVIQFITTNTQAVMDQIPPAATFNLQNGIFTTSNVPTPFTLSLANTPILFLDPNADPSALASSSALIAMGKTHMRAVTSAENTVELINYQQAEFQNTTFTGEHVHTALQAINRFITRYKTVFPLGIILALTIFLWLQRLLQSLFYALILNLFGSLFSRTYRFKHYWHITLHSIIVAEVINTLVLVTYHQTYPFVFSLAFIGVTLLAYLNLPAYSKENNK